MTIQSTAHTTQARHKPQRSQEKRPPKEQPKAQIQIESEPVPSTKDPGWHYFWAKHLNTKRKDWAILCEKDQASWVIQQKQDNLQLVEGTHFADEQIKTEDGWITRSVLSNEFYLDEPEPEEPPMTWSQPGQEVPVVVQPQAPNQIVALASETIANWLALRQTYQEFRTIPGFDDITFRAVMGATISVGRKS
jgi:hypothetical protein